MKIIYLLTCAILFLNGCGGSLHRSSWWGDANHALAKNIIASINDARAKSRKCGNVFFRPVQPVTWNDKLGQASLDHSLDMAQTGYLGHKGSDNSGPGERLSRAGYIWAHYGENIGQGYRTPQDAVEDWLKNEMHCRNIMNPKFREAGAAYAKNSRLRSFWTLVLGKPKK